ncbi:hypothetical protein [Streptomyces sp. NPDC049555]|uniref:hypothetical protein n=1 Tax=unclassified Streptomyces TaxID=2593676 RepID=UPI003434BE82
MSRASDSSSSGPKGRGGASYPSGTQPYGTPTGEEAATGAAPASPASAAQGEPKTETTLTTRIRINIPGSRPIPPVVMRTPVGDEGAAADPAAAPASAPAPAPGGGEPPRSRAGLPTRPKPTKKTPAAAAGAAAAAAADGTPAAGAGGAGGEKTSDWFAPRKSSGATSAPRRQPPLPRRDPAGHLPQGGTPTGADAGWQGDVPSTGTPAWTDTAQGPGRGQAGAAKKRPAGRKAAAADAASRGTGSGAADAWGNGQAPAGTDAWANGAAPTGTGAGVGSGTDAWANPQGQSQGQGQGQGQGQAGGGNAWGGAAAGADAWANGQGSGQGQAGAGKKQPVGRKARGAAAPGAGAAGAAAAQAGGAAPAGAWTGGQGPAGAGSAAGVGSGADAWANGSAQAGGPAGAGSGARKQGSAGGGSAAGAGSGADAWANGPAQAGGPAGAGSAAGVGSGADAWGNGQAPAGWAGDPAQAGGQKANRGKGWVRDTAQQPQAQPQAPAAPGAQTTQQFPAPSIGGVPAGGAAFAAGRTDTPREGVPAVQQTQTQTQTQTQAQAQAQAKPKGKKKGGGQKPAGATAPAPVPNPAGEALVSGVPPVPPAGGQGGRPVDGGAPRVAVPKPKGAVPPPPAPAKPAAGKPAAKGKAKAAPKKKGRSKLVLLGGGLVGLVAVAYGAGLLLDHADVPNGTTVLGVDIGGKSKDEAVKKLDAALGGRASAPLKVSIGGKSAELKPSVAGLAIDTQETVRAAAGRDYNPVTVLGSLVGSTHAAEPAVTVDEEKVAAALKTLAGETGAAKDGTIKFEPGKAVAVYGQPYEGLDVDKSVQAVAKAYRDRAASGQDRPVTLTTSAQQPKVSNAEVDRMMKEFAVPAMSGLVTVQTDPAHSIQFGPERSLPKILSVKEVGGKLVENYDLEALKELYGTKFNGVLIQRGDGTKKPVTPQDVAGALGKALRAKGAARVGVIPLS